MDYDIDTAAPETKAGFVAAERDAHDELLSVHDEFKSANDERLAALERLTPEERALATPLFLLSNKPTIFACNVRETDLATADTNPYVRKVRDYVGTHLACEAVVISAQIESDLVDLSPEEATAFLAACSIGPDSAPRDIPVLQQDELLASSDRAAGAATGTARPATPPVARPPEMEPASPLVSATTAASIAAQFETLAATREAAMAKLYSSEIAVRAAEDGVQIHGGYGYAEEYPVSRMYVDARVLSIFEGADETLCLKVIARRLVESAQG